MGKIINNNYELLEKLGQGGMGVVYKARHIHFNEIVAIKRLWEQFSNDSIVLELFLNEGKILRSLQHQNIVQVSGLFAFDGSHYIVMEYIEGRTLSDIIKREVGPIRRERANNLFKQMLEGMAYVHGQNPPVVHRDIKPLNILVTSDDTIKITDFGIAKTLDIGRHTSTVVKGTPVYMSPEQIIAPSTVDIRTDVYSLGMTFYEMLCGRTPFSLTMDITPTAVYHEIMSDHIPPPTEFYPAISEDIVHFVMKAIHKDREQRFADAYEMLRELDGIEQSGVTKNDENLERTNYAYKHKLAQSGDQNRLINFERFTNLRKNNNIWEWVAISLVVIGVAMAFNLSHINEFVFSMTPEQQKEMINVEGGTFIIGINSYSSSELQEHKVTVSSFLIGKYEVTQELWEITMGNNPSTYKGSVRPVEMVSWYEAVEFCNKLSEKDGLQKAYSGKGENIKCDFNSNGYRLPTEAEWEIAARGGKKSKNFKYSGSNELSEVGWFGANFNSGNRTREEGTSKIAKKKENELGIYDMSGNVGEWCWDSYGVNNLSSEVKLEGRIHRSSQVVRGGSWTNYAEYCMVSGRNSVDPAYRNDDLGFRIVRTR